MKNSQKGKYAEKLEDCWNNDCHEGTLTLFGKEITIFTREARDEDDYGGDKCAFINDEYWTGWYEEDLGNDLERVMKDVVNELFQDANNIVHFKATGNISNTSENTIKGITEIINNTICKDIEYDLCGKIEKVIVNKKEGKYTIFFSGRKVTTNSVLLDDEYISGPDDYNISDPKIECLDEEVKEFYKVAFSYSISF